MKHDATYRDVFRLRRAAGRVTRGRHLHFRRAVSVFSTTSTYNRADFTQDLEMRVHNHNNNDDGLAKYCTAQQQHSTQQPEQLIRLQRVAQL